MTSEYTFATVQNYQINSNFDFGCVSMSDSGKYILYYAYVNVGYHNSTTRKNLYGFDQCLIYISSSYGSSWYLLFFC